MGQRIATAILTVLLTGMPLVSTPAAAESRLHTMELSPAALQQRESPRPLAPRTLPERDVLRREMEKELIEFVQHNYPARLNSVMRSLQSREGKIHNDVSEATEFLSGFARGPVTFRGIWKEWEGRNRYLLVNTLRGVKGFPKAIVSFTLIPGRFRPLTVVEVDADGDGKTDRQSTALARCESLKEWLTQNL